MPPRDQQDYELRRQQIMNGALEVFASKGFESATNKDIARAAGIGSPGLIYHYFKDKADLLRQVMEQRAPLLRVLDDPTAFMDQPPREVLRFFGTSFVTVLLNPPYTALIRLMLGESLRRPHIADMMNHLGPARGIAFLANYLEHQMSLGALRRTDPRAAARCFVGPLLAYVITREIFIQPDAHTLSPEAMVETAVDVFLHGLAASG
jgi:TetR/AcrR family transcriptional regulator, mexJK operon transcriptional repressor